MKKLSKRTCSIFCILLSVQLSGQVTIGSVQEPTPGTLLDLKQENKTTKGLILPRVNLTNLKPTSPSEFAASIGGTGEWDIDRHTGLVVYNLKEGIGKCVGENYSLEGVPKVGVHIWDGEIWQLFSGITTNIETDVRTLIDHGVSNIDGVAIGSFTMRYKEEEETYYYASFGKAGTWMTQNLRTQYTPQGIKLGITGVQTDAGKEVGTNILIKSGAYPSSQNVTNPSDYDLNRSNGKEVGLLYDWYTATDHHNCSTIDQDPSRSIERS